MWLLLKFKGGSWTASQRNCFNFWILHFLATVFSPSWWLLFIFEADIFVNSSDRWILVVFFFIMGHFVQHLVRIEIVYCRCRSSFKHDYFQFYAQGNHRLTSNLVNLIPPANEVTGMQCFYTCLSFSSRGRVEGVCIPACTYLPHPNPEVSYPPEITFTPGIYLPPYQNTRSHLHALGSHLHPPPPPPPRRHLPPPLSRYIHWSGWCAVITPIVSWMFEIILR